jgi:SAM-dependent methyltransferase
MGLSEDLHEGDSAANTWCPLCQPQDVNRVTGGCTNRAFSVVPFFQIHPADLERRRERCSPVLERFARLERVTSTTCNVCGGGSAAILSTTDRYGFPGRTAMCLRCGLIYNVDRFEPQGYTEFYVSGGYRQLVGAFKGVDQTIERVHAAQVQYASRLVRTFQGLIPSNPEGRMLDVGGSTGLVAEQFQKHFGHRATILEPAADEAAKAKALGLEAIVGSVETWETDEKFDVVLLCRTVEHLYDLKLSLNKIRALLKPGGLFFCDLAEFLEIVRREGPPEATTKIDHVFWLTQETAPLIYRSMGFEVAAMQLTLPPDQVGFLLRAAEPQPLQPVSPAWIHQALRFFREVSTDWNRFGSQALDAKDWVRQNAYRLKKRLSG